jgi:hypothetical protein
MCDTSVTLHLLYPYHKTLTLTRPNVSLVYKLLLSTSLTIALPYISLPLLLFHYVHTLPLLTATTASTATAASTKQR